MRLSLANISNLFRLILEETAASHSQDSASGGFLTQQSGVPVGSIQRLHGHENRTTTELYLHSIGDSERKAIEVLDGNFTENFHTNPTQTQKGLQTKICNPLI